MELFTGFYTWSRPIRSISLRAIDLVTEKDYVELSLFEDNDKLLAQENLAHTIDCLCRRFGHAACIGSKYICKIYSKEVAIFDEEGKWFIFIIY